MSTETDGTKTEHLTKSQYKARHYYDDLGIFTLEDLEAWTEQLPDDEPSAYNLKVAIQHREDFAKP